MTTGEAVETLAKRWKAISAIGFVVIASAFWIADQHNGLAASEKKNAAQDERLKKIEDLTVELAASVKGISNNLAMILQLYGIDKSNVNRWRKIPSEPCTDTLTGFPEIGSEWLKKSADSQRGWLYRATEDSTGMMLIETVELWDLTKK